MQSAFLFSFFPLSITLPSQEKTFARRLTSWSNCRLNAFQTNRKNPTQNTRVPKLLFNATCRFKRRLIQYSVLFLKTLGRSRLPPEFLSKFFLASVNPLQQTKTLDKLSKSQGILRRQDSHSLATYSFNERHCAFHNAVTHVSGDSKQSSIHCFVCLSAMPPFLESATGAEDHVISSLRSWKYRF